MGIRLYIERFFLLSWKLYKTQWNRKLELIWILLSPILLCSILVVMRIRMDASPRIDIIWDPIDLERNWIDLTDALLMREKLASELDKSHNIFVPKLVIAWAPYDYNFFAKIIEMSSESLKPIQFKSYRDCRSVEKSILDESYLAGICFDSTNFEKFYNIRMNRLADGEVIIPHFNYSIVVPSELRMVKDNWIPDSWQTIYIDDPRVSIIRRLHAQTNDGRISYIREGFINIQKAITENYLHMICKERIPNILLRRFPIDSRSEDPLMRYANRALPMLTVIGFMFPAQILVWQIVKEKESMLRSFLINMNIGNVIHFSAWFCKSVCLSLFSTVFITLIVKIQWNGNHAVLTKTPWHVVLLVLASYNVATTSFVLMLSSSFVNSILALRGLTVIWLISYMPFFLLWNNREKVMLIFRYAVYCLPNTVLALIFESLIEGEVIFNKEWEDKGYILNYDKSRITAYYGIFIFLIMTLIFSGFGIYMDVWNTSESAGRRRRHIPAPAQSGDFLYQDREDSFIPQGSQAVGVKATKIYEVEPSHRRFKIRIKKLCKRFPNNNRLALNSFTWNIYENEVTVLMGHNGCGKTTLLKILAGLEELTRGLVMVSDFNILTERHDAAMQLGLALNDDLLLGDLTVADQIRFISLVKGSSWSAAAEEIDTYTDYLNISHKKHIQVDSLSAQERNLLNICCAFAGGSPIVLIDDIHSDLDPNSKALICGLINEEKSKRTIILVSNSTELASHLADRLAIMSNGELKCTGTKPFLRNMYGHGFRLTCVKGKAFDFDGLTNLLAKFVPNPTVESDVGYKITFVLENKYEEKFPDLFDDLENIMESLDIISFRMRDTSLEEIFLRFGSEEGELTPDPSILVEDFKLVLDDVAQCVLITSRRLITRQFESLIFMRWIAHKRWLSIAIIHLLAVIIAIGSAFGSVLIYGKNYQIAPLSFNLTQFPYIAAFVETMSDHDAVIEMKESFMELIFWYDGHVKVLEENGTSGYYLLSQNDFNKEINYRYMFGASFSSDVITVWFNTIPLHAAPFALNLVHNVVARRYFDEIAAIDVTLQPLPFQAAVNTFPQTPMTFGSMLAINLGLILGSIWAGVTISDIVNPDFKKQHFLSGVGVITDVVATVLFELTRVVFVAICCMLMISLYLSPRHDFGLYVWIFLVILLVGSSTVLISHLLYIITKNAKLVFIFVILINVSGMTIFTVIVRDKLEDMDDQFQILPLFTFGEMLFKLFILYEYKWLCLDEEISFLSTSIMKCNSTPNCCIKHDYWEGGTYGNYFDIVTLVLINVVPISFLVLIEMNSVMGISFMKQIKDQLRLNKKQSKPTQNNPQDNFTVFGTDETVSTQQQLVDDIVKENRCAEMPVVCQRLVKSFGKKEVLKQIDMCIEKSECVALLGHNNTGKTTLFKLLIGDLYPSHGKIWIGGYSMENDRARCYPLIGYCSQHLSLPFNFTPRELLLIHAQMRGLPDKCCDMLCEALATVLGFMGSYRQLIQLCTTGQVRRVSFALAILGDPLIVLIDGPPGGIDPNGKRILYSLTAFMQQRGSSLLFSNMNEWDGERMCHHTPVLYDGRLWTMGAKEERYRRGYLLEVRFKRKVNADVGSARITWDRINKFPVSPFNKLIIFVEIKFPEAVLYTQEESSMAFFIPLDTTNFSDIFLIIRKDAFELNIEDFYITRNVDYFGRSALKKAKPVDET